MADNFEKWYKLINYVSKKSLKKQMPPIRVEAENYKPGQQGVAYYDKTAGNNGSKYRSDGVDIYASNSAGGGYIVGYTEPGEWLTYEVNIPSAGAYSLVARVASAAPNTSMGLKVSAGSGQQKTAQFSPTGGWTTWQDVNIGQLNLNAGQNTLRVDILGGSFSFDYLELVSGSVSSSNPTPAATTPTPAASTTTPTPVASSTFSITPTIITGTNTTRIEAENYKTGAQGVTYYDQTPGNTGGKYRSDGVDIYASNNASGAYLVGYTQDGEWLTYDIDLSTGGTYNVVGRVASGSNGSMGVKLSVDGGQQRTTPFSPSGGWTTWKDVNFGQLNLTAGRHTIRVDVLGGFSFDYLDLIPGNTSTPRQTPPQLSSNQIGQIINSRIGSNTYRGTDGIETISYLNASSAIAANLTTEVVTHKFPGSSLKPIKIMPTGDSITFGLAKTGDAGSYRDDLWRLLTNNGFNVDFVGPQSTGPDGFDKDHAGFPNWTITDISGSINNWLSTYQPDKILLTVGTNDILKRDNPTQTPERLSSLIDQITSQSPGIQVLVAAVPPVAQGYYDGAFTQQIIQYNSTIPGIVNSKVSEGKNVSFVDVFSSLQESDVPDGVHPNKDANVRIAQTWYNALVQSNSTTDKLSKIENIVGSKFDDVIIGNQAGNIINGGGGNDTLTGGGGRDVFVLKPEQATVRITDFVIGQDLLGISNGLKLEQLDFAQATGANFKDGIIEYKGKQLAVLNGVQAGSLATDSFVTV